MKKQLLFLLCIISLNSFSQEDSLLAKNYRLDFAIPEHPAMSILGSNSENILRPGNTQELFSIITSNFFSGKTPILPKDLSLEFSPGQVIGSNKITLSDYQRNNLKRILYDAKFSIGAKTSNNDSLSNLGIGLRFTWVDKTALSQNFKFTEEAVVALHKSLALKDKYIELLKKNKTKLNGIVVTDESMVEKNMDKLIDSAFYVYCKSSVIDSLDKATFETFKYQKIRKKYKDKNWNQLKFESAFAIKYSGPDSLVQNIHYSKFEMYNTLALPLGKPTTTSSGWGQMLIGLNLSTGMADSVSINNKDSALVLRDTVSYSYANGTLATRIYAGTNSFKGFLEGSGNYSTSEQLKLTLNVGTEIGIRDGLWAVIHFGNAWTKAMDVSSSKFNSDWYWKVSFRYHLPEKSKK